MKIRTLHVFFSALCILTLFFSFGGSNNIYADAGCSNFIDCINPARDPTRFSTGDGLVGTLVTAILPLVLVLGGFIAIIMIVISGIQFASSGGNPDAAAAARGRLTYALVGFVLLLLAFAITKAIDVVFLRGSGTFTSSLIPSAYAFDVDNSILFPPAANENVGSLATIIVQVLIATAGVLSFIFIIIGGFKIVTSGGDSKKLDSAKSTILYAIIGVMVALLALAIINLVQGFVYSNIKIT